MGFLDRAIARSAITGRGSPVADRGEGSTPRAKRPKCVQDFAMLKARRAGCTAALARPATFCAAAGDVYYSRRATIPGKAARRSAARKYDRIVQIGAESQRWQYRRQTLSTRESWDDHLCCV